MTERPHPAPRYSAALLLGLCLVISGGARADAPTLTIAKEWVPDRKAVIATIESVRDSSARARIGGTINLVKVKEGDWVQAGDVIAIVGDQKLALQNQGLRARIQAAQAAVVKARQDFTRADELKKSGYATAARVDEARAALDMATNMLREAEAAEKVVVQQTSEGAVLAPTAGRVLKVPVTSGSVVMPGEVIAQLSQENYILRLELPERHARFLKVGDPVLIGARGLSEDRSESLKTGAVQLVYPEIKNGRVIADVRADGLGDYFVGERTRAYVATGLRATYRVPESAVLRRSGVDFVRLATGEDIVVQTGERDDARIEILSGLRDGDVIQINAK